MTPIPDADYSLQSVCPNDADIKPNLAIDSRVQLYPGRALPGGGSNGPVRSLIGALHLDQQALIFVIRFAQSEHPLIRLIVIHDPQAKSSRSRILRLALVLCSLAAWGLALSAAQAPAAKGRGESGGKAPVIESESESNISERGATMEAQINPEGAETKYELWIECVVVYTFQCGPTEGVGSGRLPAGDSGQAVSLALSDLQSGNSYRYWVVATNSEGATKGAVLTFESSKSWPGPVSETGAASNVTEREATLEGEIEPAVHEFAEFEYFFEYGASTSYGSSTPTPPEGTIGPSGRCFLFCEGEKIKPDRVSVGLTGLEPGTTYHYRLVSTNVNEGYRSFGEDATFTTGGEKLPPSSGGSETPSTTGGDGQPGASSTQSSLTSGVAPFVSPLGGTIGPKAKVLTKAQKLAKALKRCRQEPKREQAACGREARKKKQAIAGKDTGERASEHDQRRRE